MQEVIIGKEGTQKFPINNSRVSRQHAKITVSDSGQWTLEDLNSTNGTYIIDDNDELVQIKKVSITEFTRVSLPTRQVWVSLSLPTMLLRMIPKITRLSFNMFFVFTTRL